nr:MAG TPA: hypothetical protein [Caudoviricetes sp.]
MSNLFNPPKTVELDLVGLNSNAFYLMGAFSKAARRQGWSSEEINLVLDECRSSDYDHLLQTLICHTIPTDDDNLEDEE